MTIRDIARMAGVSVTTVSRVLNNTGYVSAGTRETIESLIKEHNYRPNAVARSLIRQDTEMIAVILPGRLNPFYGKSLDAVDVRAEREGHCVLFNNTAEDPQKQHHAVTQAIEHRVRGILILPVMNTMRRPAELLEEAVQSGIAVVLVDREVPRGAFDAVFIDNSQVVYEGVSLFLEIGHRDVAIITCPEAESRGRGRLDGYRRCLSDWKLPVRDKYIYHGVFDEQSGYDACVQFFGLHHPPTAVLATCSSAALGCIRYLNEHRMTAGSDVGLIGFDDIALLNAIGYRLTVMDRPMDEMADLAYDMLVEQMQNPKSSRSRRKVLLEPELLLRGSEGLAMEYPQEREIDDDKQDTIAG